jgi:23S rRNA (cytidine1920-2'-O)/16S rRNA (cytidine1409-2'-O)-methyltransferase
MPVTRRRLDSELVRRGLVSSRQGARSLIESGDVLVSGATADKPARMVSAGEPIVVQGPPPAFVGRAGGKLDAALDAFGIDVAGIRAIDVGASTGGFTDCLLQRGASGVVALDVGHGQLHERLRGDDRVTVVERCNVRTLDPAVCAPDKRQALVGDQVPLVVADLSFISLRTVRDALAGLLVPGGEMVLLVKPQFEAGRQQVSRGSGVITDPAIWAGVLGDVISHFAVAGLALVGLIESPVRGTRGNVEFLAHLSDQRPTAQGDVNDAAVGDVGSLIDAVVSQAEHGDVAQGDRSRQAPSDDAPGSAPPLGAPSCQ